MATSYHEIYNNFLPTVMDYDMLEKAQDITEKDLHRLMMKAVGYIEDMVSRTVLIDLTQRDDVKQEFQEDLPQALINLIVTGMDYYWILPQYLNAEHMRQVTNTKDFSLFANHNMMFRMREVKEELEDNWRRERSWFSQRYGELRRMVKGRS